MTKWLESALRMLAGGLAFGAGTELMPSLGRDGDRFSGISPGPGFFSSLRDKDPKKRRRRRRALTASDKVDIAFIAGILGKPAGKDIAAIIAART